MGKFDNNDKIIEIEDENGNIIRAKIENRFDYNGQTYFIAKDVDKEEGYLFKLIQTPQGNKLIRVHEKEEFNRLSSILTVFVKQLEEDMEEQKHSKSIDSSVLFV